MRLHCQLAVHPKQLQLQHLDLALDAREYFGTMEFLPLMVPFVYAVPAIQCAIRICDPRRGRTQMQVKTPPVLTEPVFERLATCDSITIVVERMPDGKMRVKSNTSDLERTFSPDQVLEIRNASGVLHVARKAKHPDAWDPPVEPYDPYGPGVDQRALSDFDVITDEPSIDKITRDDEPVTHDGAETDALPVEPGRSAYLR